MCSVFKFGKNKLHYSKVIICASVLSFILVWNYLPGSGFTILDEVKHRVSFVHKRKDGTKEFKCFGKGIYFHETSGKGSLNAREACAVESAARAHPDWQIHVIFTESPNTTFIKQIKEIFKELTNVEYDAIDVNKYVEGTPAHSVVADGKLNQSKWIVSHTSDVLRYTTLYKHGGIYLDLDIIVAKSLDELSSNWAAYEDDENVNSAALGFSCDEIGRWIADASIYELESSFSGNSWSNNGPGVITRVLKKLCFENKTAAESDDTCSGIKIYKPSYFYPIHYNEAKVYFETSYKTVPEAYGYHVWNKLTYHLKIEKDSPYDQLARKYCPSVYNTGTLS